jgi:hypothetical protein
MQTDEWMDGWLDGQTEMTRLTVTIQTFVNMPKNKMSPPLCIYFSLILKKIKASHAKVKTVGAHL